MPKILKHVNSRHSTPYIQNITNLGCVINKSGINNVSERNKSPSVKSDFDHIIAHATS